MSKLTGGLSGFKMNPALPKLLEKDALMELYLKGRAEEGAHRAREIAPRETGAYADSIEGEAGVEYGVARGRVLARDFKAGWIEFGTVNWPAHATLRRAVESIGLGIIGGNRRH